MKKHVLVIAIVVSFIVGWFASNRVGKVCITEVFKTFERPMVCKIIFAEF